MKIKELFEILQGNSKIEIQWEQQSQSKKVGYFSLDNKIVYGIRKIEIDGNEIGYDNLTFIDFGWFDNGVLKYDLLHTSLYPSSVLNTVFSAVKDELLSEKTVVFVAKKNKEKEETYHKRLAFYDSMVQLRSRKYEYENIQFENEDNETVFCLSRQKLPSKLSVLNLCRKLNDSSWLSFANAKRVLTSLKRSK